MDNNNSYAIQMRNTRMQTLPRILNFSESDNLKTHLELRSDKTERFLFKKAKWKGC